MNRRLLCAGGAVLVAAPNLARATDKPRHDLEQILADRVAVLDGPSPVIGIAAATIGGGGERVYSAGRFGQPDPSTTPGRVLFEIGSLTKVFTGLLLADMVARGELELSDPADAHLPPGPPLPRRNGKAITLVDLATHTAGLPFMPDAGVSSTQEAWRRFVAGHALTTDIGSQWEYSNLGYWLLGEALSHRSGMAFDTLVSRRLLAPLRLNDTAFSPSAKLARRLAIGRDAGLEPAAPISKIPGYELVGVSGAGGLYSTVSDLSRFLAAAGGLSTSPLRKGFSTMLSVRRPIGSSGRDQALGWVVIGRGGDEILFHDGSTLGCSSAVAFSGGRRLGVSVLENQITSVADIALHTLDPSMPLAKPSSTRHVEVAVATVVLAGYAGRYISREEGAFTLSLEGDHLVLEAPGDWGLPKLRLHAESSTAFYATELPLRVVIEKSADGRVTGAVIYPPRGQKGVHADRAP